MDDSQDSLTTFADASTGSPIAARAHLQEAKDGQSLLPAWSSTAPSRISKLTHNKDLANNNSLLGQLTGYASSDEEITDDLNAQQTISRSSGKFGNNKSTGPFGNELGFSERSKGGGGSATPVRRLQPLPSHRPQPSNDDNPPRPKPTNSSVATKRSRVQPAAVLPRERSQAKPHQATQVRQRGSIPTSKGEESKNRGALASKVELSGPKMKKRAASPLGPISHVKRPKVRGGFIDDSGEDSEGDSGKSNRCNEPSQFDFEQKGRHDSVPEISPSGLMALIAKKNSSSASNARHASSDARAASASRASSVSSALSGPSASSPPMKSYDPKKLKAMQLAKAQNREAMRSASNNGPAAATTSSPVIFAKQAGTPPDMSQGLVSRAPSVPKSDAPPARKILGYHAGLGAVSKQLPPKSSLGTQQRGSASTNATPFSASNQIGLKTPNMVSTVVKPPTQKSSGAPSIGAKTTSNKVLTPSSKEKPLAAQQRAVKPPPSEAGELPTKATSTQPANKETTTKMNDKTAPSTLIRREPITPLGPSQRSKVIVDATSNSNKRTPTPAITTARKQNATAGTSSKTADRIPQSGSVFGDLIKEARHSEQSSTEPKSTQGLTAPVIDDARVQGQNAVSGVQIAPKSHDGSAMAAARNRPLSGQTIVAGTSNRSTGGSNLTQHPGDTSISKAPPLPATTQIAASKVDSAAPKPSVGQAKAPGQAGKRDASEGHTTALPPSKKAVVEAVNPARSARPSVSDQGKPKRLSSIINGVKPAAGKNNAAQEKTPMSAKPRAQVDSAGSLSSAASKPRTAVARSDTDGTVSAGSLVAPVKTGQVSNASKKTETLPIGKSSSMTASGPAPQPSSKSQTKLQPSQVASAALKGPVSNPSRAPVTPAVAEQDSCMPSMSSMLEPVVAHKTVVPATASAKNSPSATAVVRKQSEARNIGNKVPSQEKQALTKDAPNGKVISKLAAPYSRTPNGTARNSVPSSGGRSGGGEQSSKRESIVPPKPGTAKKQAQQESAKLPAVGSSRSEPPTAIDVTAPPPLQDSPIKPVDATQLLDPSRDTADPPKKSAPVIESGSKQRNVQAGHNVELQKRRDKPLKISENSQEQDEVDRRQQQSVQLPLTYPLKQPSSKPHPLKRIAPMLMGPCSPRKNQEETYTPTKPPAEPKIKAAPRETVCLPPPELPAGAEPYFEYSIHRKTWRAPQTEDSVAAKEVIMTLFTNIDEANAQAETLFNDEREREEQFFQVQYDKWSIKRDEHGCKIFKASCCTLLYPEHKSWSKMWVQRDEVSALAGGVPKEMRHTNLVPKSMYLVSLWRFVPNPSKNDIKDEGAMHTDDEDTKDKDDEDAMDIDDEDTMHTDEGDAVDTNDGDAVDTGESYLRVKHRVPGARIFSTLKDANRAAHRLQIQMSYKKKQQEMKPDEAAWQERKLHELDQCLHESIEKKECWRTVFIESGLGSTKYEVEVTRESMSGPTNV